MKLLSFLVLLSSNLCFGHSTVIFERFHDSGLEEQYVFEFERQLSLILIQDFGGVAASISARYFCSYSALFDSYCVVDASNEFGSVASYSLKFANEKIKVLEKVID